MAENNLENVRAEIEKLEAETSLLRLKADRCETVAVIPAALSAVVAANSIALQQNTGT